MSQAIYLPFREQALLHVLSVKSQYSAFAQSSLTRHSKIDSPLYQVYITKKNIININDQSIASTKTKYIKLNTKTQNIFCR